MQWSKGLHERDRGLRSLEFSPRRRLVIEGYEIPYLEGWIVNGEHSCGERSEESMWHFRLDTSRSLEVPVKYGLGVAAFIAEAMAYAAGYSCFGENSQPLNQFHRRLSRLETVSDVEAMQAEGMES